MVEHRLGSADSGAVVRAHPGDVVIVTLDENPTTGYRWQVEQTGEDVPIEADSHFEPVPGDAIGSGGRRRFAFRVSVPGRLDARLALRRAWELPGEAIDRWHVTVDVGPAAE